MRRDLAERNFAFVESELNQERASALARAVRKVETSHERCTQLAERLDESGETYDVDLLDEYREARERFMQLRWELCVHREAIRLNNHRWIDNTFPTPPRR